MTTLPLFDIPEPDRIIPPEPDWDAPVFRLLVSGGSDALDPAPVRQELERVCARICGVLVLVHGAAPGVDRLSAAWARERGLVPEPHPADWKHLKKAAGGIRNQVMVDLGAHLCLAMPTPRSRGTWDCVRRARKAHIPVDVVRIFPSPA